MNPSNLNTAVGVIAVICVIAFSFMITLGTHEGVPDRAKFNVNTKDRYVVPCPVPGQFIFHPLPNQNFDDVFLKFDGSVSWGDLKKKDHPYHDFGFPETREWATFVMYGPRVSLFRSLLFPPPSRWDDEGFWRY